MPVYLYQHPETREVIEITQRMNDIHEYTDPSGIKYSRVFLSPNAATDTVVDPFSKEDFLRRTKKKMTLGDMMDESKALSEKREKKAGIDGMKESFMQKYEKRTGKPHPERKKKKQIIDSKHFTLEV
jgi:hypothetical protein